MISKALLWFGLMVVCIVGYLLYKHYRHTWGYDDDTVTHDYSTPNSSFNAPPPLPSSFITIRIAA